MRPVTAASLTILGVALSWGLEAPFRAGQILGPRQALAEDPKKAAADTHDSNPLAADNPFVGEFGNEEMLVTIRLTVESYVGEIRRGGDSYPIKGKVKAGSLSGVFTYNEADYPFSASFDGVVLKLTTGNKTHLLERKGPGRAAPAAPAPAPDADPSAKAPVKPPAIATPAPDPGVDPRSVLIPRHAPPFAKALPLPADLKADAGRSWSGFPVGTYVVIEQESSLRGKISPLKQRSAFVFQGVTKGVEMVVAMQLHDATWETDSRPMHWMTQAQTFAQLGYTAGTPARETLMVDGRSLDCTTVLFTIDDRKAGQVEPRQLKVWTAEGLSLPPQTFPLPCGFTLLEAGVVRFATVDDEKEKYRVQYQLESLRHKLTIGQQNIDAALFQGREVIGVAANANERRHQRVVTSQIPGGLGSSSTEWRRGSDVASTQTTTVVEMGVAKPK